MDESDPTDNHASEGPPMLRLDLDRYLPMLEEHDLTTEQKNQLLSTLWEIMRAMVEIGWGVHQLQLFSRDRDFSGADSSSLLEVKRPTEALQAAVEGRESETS